MHRLVTSAKLLKQASRPSSARWFAQTILRMPALSPTMESGKLTAWHKQEGDEIAPGDVLAGVETDKATVDFENQEDGVLAKILVEAGAEDVRVGVPIAIMVDDSDELASVTDADVEAAKAESSKTQSEPQPSVQSTGSVEPASSQPADQSDGSEPRMSPAAASIIRSRNLDPKSIKGTSKHGIISKQDVILGLKAGTASGLSGAVQQADRTPSAAPAPASAPAQAAPAQQASHHEPSHDFSKPQFERPGGSYQDTTPSQIRKIISQRLTQSKAEIPHFYSVMDCRLDRLLELRKQLKAQGVNTSVNDMIVAASAKALRDVPEVNCSWDESKGVIRANSSVDVSVAVATDGGLITPIVKTADRLGLSAINSAIKDLAGRARANKLKPEEFQGGSFTISNLGMFGIDQFTAVINPPQSCILAVGQGAQEVVWDEAGESPITVTQMSVQLSGDRRVVDDHIAAQFLQAFRQYIENPLLLIA